MAGSSSPDIKSQVFGAADRIRRTIVAAMDGGADREGPNSGFRIAFSRCESPIEQAYCLELFQVPGIRAIDGDFTPAMLAHPANGRQILVFAQQPILQYRADFLLVSTSTFSAEPLFMIVECDGEAFHSTREQLRRDQGRQRVLANTGFGVIRFSGSEIHRDPRNTITRTIAEFAKHGWNPLNCPNWVNDWEFRKVLAELRELG